MDEITRRLSMGAAGAGEKIYIEDVFSTWLYTGNSSTQTITNGIDLSGKGGLVWFAPRNTANLNRALVNTVRGTLYNVWSNDDENERSDGLLSSFNSDGFTLANPAANQINQSPYNYTSWAFRMEPGFFDVVEYTGNGTAGHQIPHNLGCVPGCILIKRLNYFGVNTDWNSDWQVYHRGLSNTEYMVLNSTGAKLTGTDRWNSTSPTSTHFTLGDSERVNGNNYQYIAYLFAHDEQIFGDGGNQSVIKCGTFNPTAGETINLGWEAQFVIARPVTITSNWYAWDNMRNNIINVNDYSQQEGNPSYISTHATGFSVNQAAFGSGTCIYIAIRRGPMKTPTDATKVFDVTSFTGNSNANVITSNVDMKGGGGRLYWSKIISGSNDGTGYCIMDDLRGASVYLDSASTNGDISPANSDWGVQNFIKHNNWFYNSSSSTYIAWMFRRAPGFFDAVAYTGTGATQRDLNHSLGSVPELIIYKSRSASSTWGVLCKTITPQVGELELNATTSFGNSGFTAISPYFATSSTFRVGSSWLSKGSGFNSNGTTYIAYLFATCPGVSKVGSYTGTGSDINVDCGFTSGARFIIIKRTDTQITTGFETNWYVWDTTRGIVSGNDNSLELNTGDPTKNNDWIDPLSSGFTVTSSAPAALNTSGGTYIFLAIA